MTPLISPTVKLNYPNSPYLESLLQEEEDSDFLQNDEPQDPAELPSFQKQQDTEYPDIESLEQGQEPYPQSMPEEEDTAFDFDSPQDEDALNAVASVESEEDPASVSVRRGWWWRLFRGDSACTRYFRPLSGDPISKKFYRDHICLVRRGNPPNLNAFCRDFRRGPQV